ncbi:hypothetical protein CAEBREN_04367 [Caenorhabditis brenneri]|uniref:PAN-3 domain-containing protein n=1 Tax=Caenorhabditis brenneri TaxID=135651 RepID=G0NQ55_CAEBE|nr:hypothetical protein CAEBREN_04367 [Caenorhabditis brenneri]
MNLLRLILIGSLIRAGSSTIVQKMVVVWGTPELLDGCAINVSSTWDQCLQNCLKTEDCVTSVLDASEQCHLCNFKNVSNVQQTTKEDKVKVGFKVKVDISEKECPSGENGPTFGNQPAEGDASTTDESGKIQTYTITWTGSGWTFDKFSKSRCTVGFAFSRRATIDWCLAIVKATGRNTSYSSAPSLCKEKGTIMVMSGIANAFEMEGLSYQMCRYRERDSTTINAFADAKRTEECQATPKSEKCMSIEGFTTVDKAVQNFDAYEFFTDASAGATSGKQCMVMLGDIENQGKMDFQECESNFDYPVWGVICGHEAFT